LTDWTYRKSHIINFATDAGTLYQKQITVHYGEGVDSDDDVYLNSHCRTDFGDIRFTDDDGDTLLDCWMESKVDSNYAIFWVEIADSLSTDPATIYVYYDKADATYPYLANDSAQGEATFPFFDHFPGVALDTAKWDVYGTGNYSVVDSELVLSHALYDRWERVQSKTAFGVGYAFRIRFRTSDPSDYNKYDYLEWGDTSTGENPTNFIGYYKNDYHNRFWRTPTQSIDKGSMTSTEYKLIEVGRDGSASARCFYENTYEDQLTTGVNDTNKKVSIKVGRSSNADQHTGYTDWVLVRKFIYAEPTHGAWGVEEEEGTTSKNILESLLFIGNISKSVSKQKDEVLALTDFSYNSPLFLWLGGFETFNLSSSYLLEIRKILQETIAGKFLSPFQEWGKRKYHLINGATGAGTNYQIRIKVYYGTGTSTGENVYLDSHSNADFSDIRFSASNSVTPLDYWLEMKVDSSYAIFWVEVGANLDSSQGIFIYYGNPSATTTTSNGLATFQVFHEAVSAFSAALGVVPLTTIPNPQDPGDYFITPQQVDGKYICPRLWFRSYGGKKWSLSVEPLLYLEAYQDMGNNGVCGVNFAFRTSDPGAGWKTSNLYPPDTSIDKKHIVVLDYSNAGNQATLFFYSTYSIGDDVPSGAVAASYTLDSTSRTIQEFVYKGSLYHIISQANTNSKVSNWKIYYAIAKYSSTEPVHGYWGSEEDGGPRLYCTSYKILTGEIHFSDYRWITWWLKENINILGNIVFIIKKFLRQPELDIRVVEDPA